MQGVTFLHRASEETFLHGAQCRCDHSIEKGDKCLAGIRLHTISTNSENYGWGRIENTWTRSVDFKEHVWHLDSRERSMVDHNSEHLREYYEHR